MLKQIIAAVVGCAALASGGEAFAAGGLPDAHSQVRLLPTGTLAGGERRAVLIIKMRSGWKTYWRNPGDSGIPPRMDWSRSSNVADIKVIWPTPRVFDAAGDRSYGYDGEVGFPLRVTPRDPKAPVALELDLFYGVCSEVCIPENASLSATLAPEESDQGSGIYAKFAGRAPLTPDDAQIEGAVCTLKGANDEMIFTAALAVRGEWATPQAAIVEAPGDAWVGRASMSSAKGGLRIEAPVNVFKGAFAPEKMIVTLIAGNRSVEIRNCSSGAG